MSFLQGIFPNRSENWCVFGTICKKSQKSKSSFSNPSENTLIFETIWKRHGNSSYPICTKNDTRVRMRVISLMHEVTQQQSALHQSNRQIIWWQSFLLFCEMFMCNHTFSKRIFITVKWVSDVISFGLLFPLWFNHDATDVKKKTTKNITNKKIYQYFIYTVSTGL